MPPTAATTSASRARGDPSPAFREELLKDGVECLLSGDVDTGRGRSPSGIREHRHGPLDFLHIITNCGNHMENIYPHIGIGDISSPPHAPSASGF